MFILTRMLHFVFQMLLVTDEKYHQSGRRFVMNIYFI